MFKPTVEKSEITRVYINEIISGCNSQKDYTIVYGYNIKQGIFANKISLFIIGFNEKTLEVIIVPITPEGQIIKTVVLNKKNINSVKLNYSSQATIKSELGTYSLVVPPYTPTTLESSGVLPIVQEQEAEAFRSFMNLLK